MKHLSLIIITAAGMACIAFSAAKTVNLSGVWILDPSHNDIRHTSNSLPKLNSTIGIGGGYPVGGDENKSDAYFLELPEARIQDLRLTITQTGDAVRTMRQFTIDGEERTVAQSFMLNGSQCINVSSNGLGEFVSRTRWKNNKLINSGTQTTALGGRTTEFSAEETYTISKNGKKLTIETSFVTPQGVIRLKQVFKKAQEPKS